MALIRCYECEKKISDKAPACPHCGAPKEEQPPELEEAEILESVAAVDEPEPTTQETVSAPSTEPEPVATKDERFNLYVTIVVGAFVWQIARTLGIGLGFLLSGIPMVLLHRYGKKQSPRVYAGIIGALFVVLNIAIAAGPGDVFIPTRQVRPTPPPSAATRQVRPFPSVWLARAEQGDAEAQYMQGIMSQDYAEAVRWYRLAAEQEHADAQVTLGYVYSLGEGVPEDDAEAVRWYRLAAEQGNVGGQAALGRMYARGEGVPVNYVLAYIVVQSRGGPRKCACEERHERPEARARRADE